MDDADMEILQEALEEDVSKQVAVRPRKRKPKAKAKAKEKAQKKNSCQRCASKGCFCGTCSGFRREKRCTNKEEQLEEENDFFSLPFC